AAKGTAGYGDNNSSIGNNIDLDSAENSMGIGTNLVGGNTGVFLLGDQDTVSGAGSIVMGLGNNNRASRSAVIGKWNYATGAEHVVMGVSDSIKGSANSSILGGNVNLIENSSNATLGGGLNNKIVGSSFSTIAGGERNRVHIDDNGSVTFNHAFIGGGTDNQASENYAYVGGGSHNQASGEVANISGGWYNTSSGNASAVGGGGNNTASGVRSTVPGGEQNTAAGDYSFAAGRRAKANNNGSFVWADDTEADFASTADDQFLIRAGGGVGINTTTPSTALEVIGTVDADAFTINGTPVGSSTDSYWNQSGSNVYYNTGNVGVGTTTPTEQLEVDGNLKVSGTITSGTGAVTIDGVNNDIGIGNATNGISLSAPANTGSSTLLSASRNGSTILSASTDDHGPVVSLQSETVPGDGIAFGPPNTVFNVMSATKNGTEAFATTVDEHGAVVSMKSLTTPGDEISFGPPNTVFKVFSATKNGYESLSATIDGTGPTMRLIPPEPGSAHSEWTSQQFRFVNSDSSEQMSLTPEAVSLGTGWTTADYTGDGILIVGSPDGGVSFDTTLIYNSGVSIRTGGGQLDLGAVGVVIPEGVFKDGSGTTRMRIGGSTYDINLADDAGNTRLAMDATTSGGRIAFTSAPFLRKDGTMAADTNLQITPEGSIVGKGSIVMGENSTGATWATCFGYNNTASGDSATISGGYNNSASGYASTVAGGNNNTASSRGAAISGGLGNSASGTHSAVSGGQTNSASGLHSMIPGGLLNDATGWASFAAGRRAQAIHDGSFVWADHTNADVASERADQFRVRADGGSRFDDGAEWVNIRDDATDLLTTSTGAHLTLGGTWSNSSDRNLKENFNEIDKRELLNKLSELKITLWNYKKEGSEIAHLGPVSQDFYATFGLGSNDKSIATVDADGVALAAIQGLHQQNQDLKSRITELENLVKQLLAERQ
ncbi:MAG: hypothetical protein GF341_10950, partial [candidate division Zixibacteria bacterium]|nr:hypothetical protein [candidate division Zixibacteria bacterium]